MARVNINVMIAPAYKKLVLPQLLENTAVATLEHQKADPTSELTIAVDGDEKLHELNNQFLGVDSPTDVLSFPSGEVDPETGHFYQGDIIISYPRALHQAEEADQSVEEEIKLLVVHGVLHLLGYDHAEPEEKQVMWSIQREILNQLGNTFSHYLDE
jgi:probable rRNA maturation factor